MHGFVKGDPNLIYIYIFFFFFFFFFFFNVDEGIEDPNVTINGPSLALQQKDIIKWHFAGGSMMAKH